MCTTNGSVKNTEKEVWISSCQQPGTRPQAASQKSSQIKVKYSPPPPHMLSVFCASHSRLHWPVALRCRASLSSSICSRSFFQRRYSALSRPVMDMVMSIEPFGPGLRLCRERRGSQSEVRGEGNEKPSSHNPYLKNDCTHGPLFLQFCSCLHVVKVQPSPVSYMSPAALLAVYVWRWARTSRVVQEVTNRLVSIGLRRGILNVTLCHI